MTNETLAERDRTREELDDLQREWLAADDTSMGYRDARENYLLALADAYEGGELVTRAEAARLVAEAVEAAYDDARKAVLALDTCEDAPDHLSYNTAVLRAAERIRAAAIRALPLPGDPLPAALRLPEISALVEAAEAAADALDMAYGDPHEEDDANRYSRKLRAALAELKGDTP